MGVSKPDHPAVGDPAPDALLLDGDGRSVTLSSQWRDEPAVLVFLRYFGCPFCQTQVVKLRDDQRRFLEAGATVVLIGQGTAEHWDGFRDRLHVPFPCLLDSTCSAYREYGLARGSLARIVTPRIAVSFVQANINPATRQRGLQGGDFMQMPGTFVVDPAGVVRLAPNDRILEVVSKLARVEDR